MPAVARDQGLSVRLKLTLSYAGFLMLAGILLLAVVWVFLLRYVPGSTVAPSLPRGPAGGLLPPELSAPSRGDLQAAFFPKAAMALAFLLALGLVGGWLLAGRMLTPLIRITDAARVATTGSLSHRIRLPGRKDEFRELADTFDAMLERLEAHVGEQRRFAANASHELRTPLAVTQALLEAALNDPTRGKDELLERLHSVNARAIGLTEALLLLSRAEQRSFTGEDVDLSLLVEEAAETLLPFAEHRGVSIVTTASTAVTAGSPALLQQLTTNLVHNAIVHNLPEHGTVWVSTSVGTRSVSLTVENTAAELSAQVVSTLTEAFQRGSKRARTEHPGVGLGLAIVKSITNAHQGTLTLIPREGGGLSVTVRLPAASNLAQGG